MAKMSVWLQFILCAALIFFAGHKLSVYGEVLGDRLKLGKSWVGIVLLGVITSLCELITSISSVTLHDLPDMAVSATIGSCLFNLLVIAMLDVLSKRPVSHVVDQGQILSAGFGIVLMGFAAIDILFGKYLPNMTSLNSSDPLSFVYILVYFIGMKLIFSYESTHSAASIIDLAHGTSESKLTTAGIITRFVLYAMIIVAASCYLPALAEQIGRMTGWGQSFIGSSFIAITTSLPEFAVSISAARRGSFNLAVGNLLGSNLFNVVILALTDFCYGKQPLLRSVSEKNALIALSTMIATGIVIIGLTYRAEKKLWLLAGDAIAILLVYVLANVLLFCTH
jgi:cation:H+ antiporter